jgi:hypothetical protein
MINNLLDGIAIGLIQSVPAWRRDGWGLGWATKRIAPIFEKLAEQAIQELVEQNRDNPKFQGRRCRITAYEQMKPDGMEAHVVLETGFSFQGACSGIFSRYRLTREVQL